MLNMNFITAPLVLIAHFMLIFSVSVNAYGKETCSRVAEINYQKVLVDSGPNQKGEGLRFYLEKDPIATELLDEYQKKNKPSRLSLASSTVGSFLLLSGLLQTNTNAGVGNRNALIYSGISLIAITYLANRTIQFNNEKVLERAVEEYNKRNRPQILFSPYVDGQGAGVGVGLSQGF